MNSIACCAYVIITSAVSHGDNPSRHLPLRLPPTELFDLEQYCDLEVWVMGHPRSLEMAPFDRSHTSSYLSSIVTMAVSFTVFEIKRDIDRKTPIFRTLPFNLHDNLDPRYFFKILIQTQTVRGAYA